MELELELAIDFFIITNFIQLSNLENKKLFVGLNQSRLTFFGGSKIYILYIMEEFKLLSTFQAHDGGVTSVTFSPDGTRVASGGYDAKIQIRNADSGDIVRALRVSDSPVMSLDFNRDGTRIVAGYHNGFILTWKRNPETDWNDPSATLEFHMNAHNSNPVASVAFNRDGTHIVSGGWDNKVKVWGIEQYERVYREKGKFGNPDIVIPYKSERLSAKLTMDQDDQDGFVTSVDFNKDGSRVVSGNDDGTVNVWNAVTGVIEQTLQGHSNRVKSVAFSPDGTRVASGSKDGTIKIWNVVTGDLEQTLEGHSYGVNSVAFSQDGRRLVSGSGDKTVKIWNATTGVIEQTLQGHTSSVDSVAFSRDGLRIVSGEFNGTVMVWTNDYKNALNELKRSYAYMEKMSENLKFRGKPDFQERGIDMHIASFLNPDIDSRTAYKKYNHKLNLAKFNKVFPKGASRKSRKGFSRSPAKSKPRSRSRKHKSL